MLHRFTLLILTMILMSSCAVGPTKQMAASAMISPPIGVGIALAGGGTKAASYAMGVLAAVADSDKGFKQIDAISTVSGGGYSAFYLYSKLLVGEKDPTERMRPVKDYFDDCIPDIYEDVLPRPYNGYQPLCTADNYKKYQFQQFVRCRQDVLENDCKQQLGRHDRGEYAGAITNTAFLLGATGLMITPSLIANTAFDWPINMSPTRNTYMEGIGTAYGLYPRSTAKINETSNILSVCNDSMFLNCDSNSGSARVKREGLGFGNLQDLTSARAGSVPVWYINATASKSRSVFGWAQKGRRDFTKYTLQMSPSSARSGYYGQIPKHGNLDLLDGVTASAAFFDANETKYKQPWRMLFAAGQHLAVLDWGTDIPNPTVNTSWRILHSFLFSPFYFIDGGLRKVAGGEEYQDSVYIRLLDGGNNDNLGAFTLIEAGMKHIIISDHAFDGTAVKNGSKVTDSIAKVDDVCLLHNEVALRSPGGESRKLVIPGLENLPQHCLSYVTASECGDKSCTAVPGVNGAELSKGGYSILEWKHQVLLGCITSQNNNENKCDAANDVRIYVLKPAFDLETFKNDYLERSPTGKYGVQQKTCSDRNNPGVCEVAAYLADWYNHADEGAVLQPFPQNTTVAVTFASTGKVYGAYRELARWHMHDALEKLTISNDEFNKILKKQAEEPIKRKRFDK